MKIPEKLKNILDKAQKPYEYLSVADPFIDILESDELYFFREYTDHGIKHIENTLQYAENLIAEDTFQYLTPDEVGVLLLSVVLHDIGMHTNAEMFKNMIDGKYDNLVNLFPDGKTWKELWEAFLYDSQYWGEERKKNVFGKTDYNICIPDLSDLQLLTEYDRKLIGEFVRIHHCRIAHEVALNGYMGRETIHFVRNGIKPLYFKIAGIVARSHGMDVRDTFGYLKGLSGRINNTSGIHAVYLMVLLRLADYLQIDNSRTNASLLKINTLYSPYSRQEHRTHLSIENVEFTNTDKEKIDIQAYPEDAQTYVKIEKLTEDIQKELDRSWAILGEVYPDYNYKLRYRRVITNISDNDYKDNLEYVPQQFCFRYNNDLFKLLIAPLYGDNPSYGVRELVQNAVDACRLCMDEIPSDGEPHVKVEVDSQKSLFTITDRGKGMNLNEIKNYFLTIGSSYNDNIDWKKARDQEHIYRTGRFGIGVLAAFLLGPEIYVVTKKRKEKMGYRFTASLQNRFIQIEKASDAEYGTKIEIQCDEKCMNRFKGNNNSWFSWYIGKNPKVEYYYDGELKTPNFNLSEYKDLKYSSESFGDVYWKPQRLNGYSSRALYCNGFFICDKPRKKTFSSHDFEDFSHMNIPSLLITDSYNQLPLNLNRDNIDEGVRYDFEDILAREVFIDIMCQLMAKDIDGLLRSDDFYYYHAEGFSLKSSFMDSYIKSNRRVIISFEDYRRYRFYDRNRTSFRTNEIVKLIDNLQYFIQFDRTDQDAGISWFTNRLEDVYESYESLRRSPFSRRIDNNSERTKALLYSHFGRAFAIIDNNTRPFQTFKQQFINETHSVDGWLIFAPSNSDSEFLERIIHHGNESIHFVRITDKESKSSVPQICIDNLFEKYMHNDPIVPYEMEERKKKFPLLFQDYSEIIEHYMK